MIAYEVAKKVIDTELLFQYIIVVLNLWHCIYRFVQSGQAFTMKGNTHTHTHTLAANSFHFKNFISIRQNCCAHYH